MDRNRARYKRSISLRPTCDTLEGRALLSAVNLPSGLRTALIGGIGGNLGGIKTDPAGVAAVVAALRGGPGSEFVSLIRRQVPNIGALVRRFTTGATTAASVKGVAVQIPRFQDQFTGRHFDHLATTVAGAVLLPGNTLELGVIVRGPFDEPIPAYVVFGIDRGAGASVGPAFSSRPGLTPDALVTITVAPNGTGGTGTITDLKTGAVTTIDSSRIQVNGATLRVFVDAAQLPSTGLPVAKYRFAMWTRSQLDGGIENVASFLPDTSMIPIGVSRGRGGRR